MGFCRNLCIILGVAALSLGLSSAARATLIGVSAGTFPDFTGGFLKVDYNGAGHFTAAGFTTGYSATGGTPVVPTGSAANRAYTIDMTVNPADGSFISGTITIKGMINSIPAGPNLLSGNLTAFGFINGGGQNFDFLFDVTAGDLAAAYVTNKGGMTLNAVQGSGSIPFTGSFLSSFRNYDGQTLTVASGTADAFIVPEPASLSLIAISAVSLLRRRPRVHA